MKATFSFFVLVLLMMMVGCASASPTAVPPSPTTTAIPATAVAAQPTETPIPTETALPTETATATATLTPTATATATAVGPIPLAELPLAPEGLEIERLARMTEIGYAENQVNFTYVDENGEVQPFEGFGVLNWLPETAGADVLHPFQVETMNYLTGEIGPWPLEVVQKLRELELRAMLQQVEFDSEEAKEAYLQELLAGTATEIKTTTILAYNPETGQVENTQVPVDAKIKVTVVPMEYVGPVKEEMLPVPPAYAIINQISGMPSNLNSVFYDKESNTVHYINTITSKAIDYDNEGKSGTFVSSTFIGLIILFKNHYNLMNGYSDYRDVGITVEQMINILGQTIGNNQERITHTSEMIFDKTIQLPTLDFLREAHYFPLVENGIQVGSLFVHQDETGVKVADVNEMGIVTEVLFAPGTAEVNPDTNILSLVVDGAEELNIDLSNGSYSGDVDAYFVYSDSANQ